MRLYYVYILASTARVPYVGVTGNFENRLIAHRWYSDPGSFTARYPVNRLVYFEEYTEIEHGRKSNSSSASAPHRLDDRVLRKQSAME